MARHKASEVRERAVDNGWLIPLIGAGVGALVGKALQSRAQGGRDERWFAREDYGRYDARYGYYGYPYEYRSTTGHYEAGARRYEGEGQSALEHELGGRPHEAGIGDSSRLGDKASEMKERASEVKERVSAKADEYGQRLRDQSHALRERVPDRETILTSAREDMGFWAFGALALGALFGMALPVTEREREMLEPAKRKMREASYQARDLALEKGSEALDRAQAKVGGEEEEEHHEQHEDTRSTQPPIIPASPSTPIH